MKTNNVETPKLKKAIDILASIVQYRQLNPVEKSDLLYYELLMRYLNQVLYAYQNGEYLVGHSDGIPAEIFYAMGITPINLETTSILVAQLVGEVQECLDASKIFGFSEEICSNHKAIAGTAILGWLPRPNVVVGSFSGCDSGAKMRNWYSTICNVPSFYIDKLTGCSNEALLYYAVELEELIKKLEELTHRKMDWDRLLESLMRSVQISELHEEIAQLRKSRPSPFRSRRGIQMVTLERLYCGKQEAINFYECIRDEVKTRVENKQGVVVKENHRLLSLIRVPHYAHKIWDWLEKEHGTVSVMETEHQFRRQVEVDKNNPLLSLANKAFFLHGSSFWCCSALDGPLSNVLSDANDYHADGAIYFAHKGCHQGCGMIPMFKSELERKAGIPLCVIDCDLFDPSVAPIDELKEKLEDFLLVLRNR